MKPSEIMSISPVVPVVSLERADQAVPLAEALLAGGISIIEVTLRTPAALEAIGIIAKNLPEMHVGAGTVINEETFVRAMEAGAKFAFSPGNSDELMKVSREKGYPFIPGVATASDVMNALTNGFEYCKLFPATVAGGVEALKAFSGPFASVRFCPTGGVNPDNFMEFISLKNVACVGGSWVVPAAALRENNYAEISRLCAAAFSGLEEYGISWPK